MQLHVKVRGELNELCRIQRKQQLGDRLPIAMSVAARAVGGTVQELTKMLENGELIATDFLPKFGKELSKAARKNGALTAALNTSGVAMQRFGTTIQLGVLAAFDEGAGVGLASFFNDLSATVINLTPGFRTLGRVIGKALEILGVGIRAAVQVLRPFSLLLDSITKSFSDSSEAITNTKKSVSGLAAIIQPIIKAFRTLAAFALLPFAVIEQGMDRLEKLDKGPLKDLLLLGAAIATALSTKKILGSPLKSGKAFGKLFVAGFKFALAFEIGKAIGEAFQLNNLLSETQSRVISQVVGVTADRFKAFGGDIEAKERLESQGIKPGALQRGIDFFTPEPERFPTLATMGRGVTNTGSITINVDASGLTPELGQKMVENALQEVFTGSMEAVR